MTTPDQPTQPSEEAIKMAHEFLYSSTGPSDVFLARIIDREFAELRNKLMDAENARDAHAKRVSESDEIRWRIVNERDALKKQIADLERDKARLDWLEKANLKIEFGSLKAHDFADNLQSRTIREAIDAAMKGTP